MLRIGSVVLNVSDVAGPRGSGWRRSTTSPATPVAADWAILSPRTAAGPNLSLNLGETRPDAVPHIHLDLYADDQRAEVQRLLGLGARRVEDWPYPDEPHDFVVLEDPDGNRFCVIDTTGPSEEQP